MKKNQLTVAFTCQVCKAQIGDPMYRAPIGHGPSTTCYDCWINYFEGELKPKLYLGEGDQLQTILFLLANGYNQVEIAALLSVNRSTVWRWLNRVRRDPSLLDDCPINLEGF